MKDMIYEKVRAYIMEHGMLAGGDRVVAGVSGGADSVCLLLMLYRLSEEIPFQLQVVHVDHGLRAEAREEAEYVRELCRERGIAFHLKETEVRTYAAERHLSEEEAGREVRYHAFQEVLESSDWKKEIDGRHRIATAHHINDRAETILFHLFRGTGLTGMAGIRPVREPVIRPLLCLQRSEIEEWLSGQKISYCMDASNETDCYTRNRIRRHILPYAEQEVCRGAALHLCEAGDRILEAEQFIRKQAGRVLAESRIGEAGAYREQLLLDGERLGREDSFLIRQVLLLGLEELEAGRRDVTAAHLYQLEELLHRPGNRKLDLPGGWEAVREYHRLILRKKTGEAGPEELPEVAVPVPGRILLPGFGWAEVSLLERDRIGKDWESLRTHMTNYGMFCEKSYTKWFDYDRITKSLVFRRRQQGDYFSLDEKGSRKSVKSYMIDQKIPREERDRQYLLAEGAHILWMPGGRGSRFYHVGAQTERILEIAVIPDGKEDRRQESRDLQKYKKEEPEWQRK